MWSQIRGYPLKSFLICHIAYTFSQMDMALFSYALPSIRADFQISLIQMGWVVAVSYTIGAVIQVYLGTLTDRLGRKRMLIVATLVSSVFVALHALVPIDSFYISIGALSLSFGLVMLTLLRACAIATGGALYPITGAIVTEESPARYRGLMAGLLQTGYPLGWFLASLFAAWIISLFGWRPLFLIGLLSIGYVFFISKYLLETRRFSEQFNKADLSSAQKSTSLSKVSLLFEPHMRLRTFTLFGAQFLFVIAYGGSSMFFPTYLVEARNFALNEATLIVGIGNAIGIIGYIMAAYTGEFLLTRRTTVVVWVLLGAVAFLNLIWFASSYFSTLICFGVMCIFFYGASAVKFAYVAEVFPTQLRATGLAVCSSFAVNLGIAIGPLLITYGVEYLGWKVAFSTVVAIPMLCSGLFYLTLKPIPSGLEVEEVNLRYSS